MRDLVGNVGKAVNAMLGNLFLDEVLILMKDDTQPQALNPKP